MKTALVVLLSLSGLALVTPTRGPDAVPLAGIKLVAERTTPPAELAAASRNGTRNGRTRGGGFAIAKGCFVTWEVSRPVLRDLVAVEMR